MWVLIFGQYAGPSRNKDPRPPKSYILVVWWIGIGSSQLYWADYESSCAQNIGPTTHTYSHMHTHTRTYIYIYIYIVK